MKHLLEVNNMHVRFKVKKQLFSAVRGVSFFVKEREVLGIVGESGSGKSALVKALVDLLPKQSTKLSGKALYLGNDLFSLSPKALQKIRGKEIGMIFQDPMTSLNPTMKIGKQITESYLQHNRSTKKSVAREYACHLLELVEIPQPSSFFDKYAHTLSGGMRQRVLIAMALAAKPKLIIADEITTALDVTTQAQVLDLIKTIKNQTGTSFILITHDLSIVAGYCDRVLVMYSGKVVENADTHSLFANPSHPYTQGLLHSIPRIDSPTNLPLKIIPGFSPSLKDSIEGCAFRNRCSKAIAICKEKDPELLCLNQTHSFACWRNNDAFNQD